MLRRSHIIDKCTHYTKKSENYSATESGGKTNERGRNGILSESGGRRAAEREENGLKGAVANTLRPEIRSNTALMTEIEKEFGVSGADGIANELKVRYNRDGTIGRFEKIFSDGGKAVYSALKGGVKYSVTESGAADIFSGTPGSTEALSRQIDRWLSGKMGGNEYFDIGDTPAVLRALGAKSLPIVMTQEVMSKITGEKHSISLDEIRTLPDAIADPIMVFKSATVDNAFVLLTELSDKLGRDVVAAVHMNRHNERLNVNRIASVYGRNNVLNFVKGQFANGNIKYFDKIKSQEWSTSRGLQLPKLVQSIPDNNIVLHKENVVNTYYTKKSENYSITESGGKTNERGRNGILSGNGGRRADEGSGKQTRRFYAHERADQGGTRAQRQSYAKEIAKQGLTEERTDGNHRYRLIKPEAYNDEMNHIAAEAKARGKEVAFFIGSAVRKFDGKRVFRIDGIRYPGGRIMIRYDGEFTPQALFRHEVVHDDWNTPEIQAARKQILGELSETEKRRLLSSGRYRRYMRIYKGNADAVLEEFIADTFAGMNDYTGSYSELVTGYWDPAEDIDIYTPSVYNELMDSGAGGGSGSGGNSNLSGRGESYGYGKDNPGGKLGRNNDLGSNERHPRMVEVGYIQSEDGHTSHTKNVHRSGVSAEVITSSGLTAEQARLRAQNRLEEGLGTEYFVKARTESGNKSVLFNTEHTVYYPDSEFERGDIAAGNGASLHYSVANSPRRGHWHTDLNKEEITRLMSRIRNDLRTSTQNITESANWMFTTLNGKDIFAIYSCEDAENPTLLYESSGDKAIAERDELIDILEGKKYAEDTERESSFADRVSVRNWVRTDRSSLHSTSRMGVGSDDRDASVLSRSPRRRTSRAFGSVVENLLEIRDRRRRGISESDGIKYAVANGPRRGHWHTDLNKEEITRLMSRIRNDLRTSTQNITESANWMFTTLNGKDIFAIYSYEDAESPTLLYESSGDKAIAEHDELIDTLGGIESGTHEKSNTAGTISARDRLRAGGDIVHNAEPSGRGSGGGDASVLSRSPRRRTSRAYRSVVENLLEIRERRRRGISESDGIKYAISDEGNADFWDEWLQAIEDSGVIPKGENPARDIDVPKKVGKKKFVSRFARTMLEAGITPEENVSDFEKAILDGQMTHEVITDKAAAEDARKEIKYHGFEDAMKEWEILSSKGKVGKKELALGMELYNTCITNKDVHNAMKLAAELAAEATRAGQTLQACRMLKLMTPDGQLYFLEKSIEKMNREFSAKLKSKFKGIELDTDLVQAFLFAETEAERNAAYDRLCQNIADQIPSTLLDKWNSWRYLAMLGNPRTHIRNIVGNAVFVPAVRLKNYIGAVLEKASKVKPEERTKSLYKTKAAKEFAKKDFEEMAKLVQGQNAKYAITSDVEGKRTIFKNKWLELIRRKNFDFLEAEDMWFLRSHYVDALARLITVRKLDIDSLSPGVLDAARAFAIKEAQAATYRDANALANILNKWQRSMKRDERGAIRVAGELIDGVLPFKSTPFNIVKQGVEYSPLGLIKGAYLLAKKTARGDVSAGEVIDAFSKAITGTLLGTLLGYFLASLGLIVAEDDKSKKEKAFDKMIGEQSYAVKAAGHSYTIDWMLPLALPLFIGVKLHDFTKDEFTFADITGALSTVTEPVMELSVFSGVNDLLESSEYNSENSNKIAALGYTLTANYLAQAFPTFGGQLSRMIDGTKRNYYFIDENSEVPRGLQKFIGQVSSKLPFASYLFEPSIDSWGREETYGDIPERVFENTVSPGYYSSFSLTPVDEEIARLFEQTGKDDVFPTTVGKSFTDGGIKYYLTAKEYTQVKKLRGKMSYLLAEALIESSEYEGMTDDEKAAALGNCYKTAQKEVRSVIFKASGELAEALTESPEYEDMTDVEKDKAIRKCYDVSGEARLDMLETADALIEALSASPAYSSLSDDQKVRLIKECCAAAQDEAKPAMLNLRG